MLIQIERDGTVNLMDGENWDPVIGKKAEIIDSAEGQIWIEITDE